MIEVIKKLYEQVIDKKSVCETLAKEYNRTPDSIKTNWMSSNSIPENYQERVKQIIVESLKLQISNTENLIK